MVFFGCLAVFVRPFDAFFLGAFRLAPDFVVVFAAFFFIVVLQQVRPIAYGSMRA